eukprot:918291-Rhodomonas_salina.1
MMCTALPSIHTPLPFSAASTAEAGVPRASSRVPLRACLFARAQCLFRPSSSHSAPKLHQHTEPTHQKKGAKQSDGDLGNAPESGEWGPWLEHRGVWQAEERARCGVKQRGEAQ